MNRKLPFGHDRAHRTEFLRLAGNILRHDNNDSADNDDFQAIIKAVWPKKIPDPFAATIIELP